MSSRDSVGVVGQVDLNSFNSNYDVDPRTGELLLIVRNTGEAERSPIWIQHWPELQRGRTPGRNR